MKVVLDLKKNGFENASMLFESAKKAKQKSISAEEAENKMHLAEKTKALKKKEKPAVAEKKEKEWHERFFWTMTSEGKLCIGGKNAEDNEEMAKSHFEKNDLFFHADIIGASVVVLKNGQDASEQEMLEAAQFAVCYSKAWKDGLQRANAYAVKKENIAKTNQGTVAPKGSFFILGERKWFKNLLLALKVGKKGGRIMAVPAISKIELENQIEIKPGNLKREEIAKEISKKFGIGNDEALQILPTGRFFLKRID